MTADPAVAVEVVGLKRSYRSPRGVFRRQSSEIEALRGITFSIERGELFGLLGPNGAGKTTTIKVLTTLLLPSAGMARVLGLDVARQPREVRRCIGYVFGGIAASTTVCPHSTTCATSRTFIACRRAGNGPASMSVRARRAQRS
jgi:ABC-type multidrug transport system ATPase subunit